MFDFYACAMAIAKLICLFDPTSQQARAVKLLGDKKELQEVRDLWWAEVRAEIKSHAKSLNCQFVIGYSETTTIHEGNMYKAILGAHDSKWPVN